MFSLAGSWTKAIVDMEGADRSDRVNVMKEGNAKRKADGRVDTSHSCWAPQCSPLLVVEIMNAGCVVVLLAYSRLRAA